MPLRIAAKLREPAEQAYFDRAVEPLLGDGVEYVGEVGGAEKLDLLAGAMCLLNPIAWPEPFGMVMIEALACGTPVVATPCGSVPELVTDGVTGFVRADDAGLAAALRQRRRARPWPLPPGGRRAVLDRADGGRPPRSLRAGDRRPPAFPRRLGEPIVSRELSHLASGMRHGERRRDSRT